jgi:hypothetical protein
MEQNRVKDDETWQAKCIFTRITILYEREFSEIIQKNAHFHNLAHARKENHVPRKGLRLQTIQR